MKAKIQKTILTFTGLLVSLVLAHSALAQPPGGGAPIAREPDPRTEQRTYHFEPTDEEMPYVLYVSSKVKADEPAPLIIALHGLGGDANFLVRDGLIDLAEEKGYIVAGPLGYNVSGWYGSPVINMSRDGSPVEPENLAELSELDVMNVLEMMREEFNVDADRTYLIGHSMGGAGTLFLGHKYSDQWAAIAAIAPAAFMMANDSVAMMEDMKAAGLPVMITEGDQDNVVPPDSVRQWAAAMEETGIEHEYIEIPGADHGTVIWEGMEDVFRWMETHSR